MVLGQELISFCIPVMNRLDDLRVTLPKMIRAASLSPPVEIFVLDYGSGDGLVDYLDKMRQVAPMLRWQRYENADYYHKAHAWNLTGKCAKGDWLVFMGADALLDERYVVELRKLIADGCKWVRGRHYKGIVAVRRDEFMGAGGYDERFEFSGEDKEFDQRLQRRGYKLDILPDGLVSVIRTPNSKKFLNHRPGTTKAKAIAHAAVLRAENEAQGWLVVNVGQEWGSWSGPCYG